jgi:hypothetical protein
MTTTDIELLEQLAGTPPSATGARWLSSASA